MKKVLFLFLALLLPVLIYLFLKTFGRNEFDVPVLFSDSVTVPVSCSGYTYHTPYFIEDTVLQPLAWRQTDSLTIFVLEDSSGINTHERSIQLDRTFTQFKKEPFSVVRIFQADSIPPAQNSRITNVAVNAHTFRVLKSCIFLLAAEQDAVMLDSHRCIRGQYTLLEREDADRMIMQEMNILFKRY